MLCIEKKGPSEEEKWRRATRRQKNTFILCVWAWLKKKTEPKKQQQNTLLFTGEQSGAAAAAAFTVRWGFLTRQWVLSSSVTDVV